MSKNDYFSIYELYYLIGAFDGDTIIGLPRLEDLPLPGEDIWDVTKQALVEKGFVTDEGQLTKSGFVVVNVLKDYCTGHHLTIINNLFIMLVGKKRESVLLVLSDKGYQIRSLGPIGRLQLLQEKLPLVLREPLSDEKDFLRKECLRDVLAEEALANEETLVVQHYPLQEMLKSPQQKSLIESWLFGKAENDELLAFDVRNKVLYRYSQYCFLERLCTWLAIPFREEDFV